MLWHKCAGWAAWVPKLCLRGKLMQNCPCDICPCKKGPLIKHSLHWMSPSPRCWTALTRQTPRHPHHFAACGGASFCDPWACPSSQRQTLRLYSPSPAAPSPALSPSSLWSSSHPSEAVFAPSSPAWRPRLPPHPAQYWCHPEWSPSPHQRRKPRQRRNCGGRRRTHSTSLLALRNTM